MAQTSPPPLQTTESIIRIVATLEDLDGAGATKLATHLSMSKSTVHDYLATLRRHDYVTKDSDRYEVGLGFFEVGEYARKRRKIYEVASRLSSSIDSNAQFNRSSSQSYHGPRSSAGAG